MNKEVKILSFLLSLSVSAMEQQCIELKNYKIPQEILATPALEASGKNTEVVFKLKSDFTKVTLNSSYIKLKIASLITADKGGVIKIEGDERFVAAVKIKYENKEIFFSIGRLFKGDFASKPILITLLANHIKEIDLFNSALLECENIYSLERLDAIKNSKASINFLSSLNENKQSAKNKPSKGKLKLLAYDKSTIQVEGIFKVIDTELVSSSKSAINIPKVCSNNITVVTFNDSEIIVGAVNSILTSLTWDGGAVFYHGPPHMIIKQVNKGKVERIKS